MGFTTVRFLLIVDLLEAGSDRTLRGSGLLLVVHAIAHALSQLLSLLVGIGKTLGEKLVDLVALPVLIGLPHKGTHGHAVAQVSLNPGVEVS